MKRVTRDIRSVVENLYARGDAYSPSPPPPLSAREKSPIRVHPRFPTGGGGGAEGERENVIVCPGGPGLITFPRICTSATIIAINPMTTRFPSLAQVGQPRGLSRYTIGPPLVIVPADSFFSFSLPARAVTGSIQPYFSRSVIESPPRRNSKNPLIGSSNRVSILVPISWDLCVFFFFFLEAVMFFRPRRYLISWESRIQRFSV